MQMVRYHIKVFSKMDFLMAREKLIISKASLFKQIGFKESISPSFHDPNFKKNEKLKCSSRQGFQWNYFFRNIRTLFKGEIFEDVK